jgi:hypothetical protein
MERVKKLTKRKIMKIKMDKLVGVCGECLSCDWF